MKILIRNLSKETTQAQLDALLAPFGTIQYCHLVMDKDTGQSKGFGFAEIPKVGEAKAAIIALNNTDVDGMRIRVKRAQAVPQTSNIARSAYENQ